MIGFLTLPWVMTSELYPLRSRGPLGGITTSMVQILTFATIKLYPQMHAFVGVEITMWIFTVAAGLGALFALTILPETRGRSLDEIESGFSRKSKCKSSNDTLSTTSNQPKNITLQKFASITDEKHNITTNVYAYDNFSLDLTADDTEKNRKDPSNDSDGTRDVALTVSLEHVYF